MTRIHHVTLIVEDLKSSRDFYVREFGFREREVDGLDYPGAFLIINDQQHCTWRNCRMPRRRSGGISACGCRTSAPFFTG